MTDCCQKCLGGVSHSAAAAAAAATTAAAVAAVAAAATAAATSTAPGMILLLLLLILMLAISVSLGRSSHESESIEDQLDSLRQFQETQQGRIETVHESGSMQGGWLNMCRNTAMHSSGSVLWSC